MVLMMLGKIFLRGRWELCDEDEKQNKIKTGQ